MEINPEIYKKYQIERALRRSYLKRRIVQYLSTHGFGYMAEIAHDIGATSTNVCGAMKGMDGRYVKGNSLLELGVVSEMEMKNGTKSKVFSLTSSLGQEAVRICKKFDRNI
jgi:predicted transcriptional regulator with HTH domain